MYGLCQIRRPEKDPAKNRQTESDEHFNKFPCCGQIFTLCHTVEVISIIVENDGWHNVNGI